MKIDYIRSKIIQNDNIELKRQLTILNLFEKKVIFTNGCFDILHRGHLEYLARASEFGDYLIVGLNSDQSVKRLKGNDRPLNDEVSRGLLLAALCFVDLVVVFDEDTPFELIQLIQPDVLIKGADYKPHEIVGADTVKSKGGEVITIDLVKGFSTSNIIKSLNS
jgi:rfaE bifunctional protein nucleotidyltransferase chain/domain